MALDTEAKRWSMLQAANGPPAYSHVINPSGSNYDAQVERFTLLHIYGGDLTPDTTAPVLSNPTGAATGATTATGTVDTDEGNGTLYFWATENASETAAGIKANGSSQSVSASGTQNVSVSGLTAETGYYLHYVQDDQAANESNVVSSSLFTTDAAAVEEEEQPSGGYEFWFRFEAEMERRQRGRKRRKKKREKALQIAERIDQELALAERAIEEETARRAELARLNRIVSQNQAFIASLGPRLEFVMRESLERQTFSTMERLERELRKVAEEEAFLMQAAEIILNA